MNPEVFSLHRGERPVLISLPHAGTHLPPSLRGAYVEGALDLDDTDWHLETLYDFAAGDGASLITAHVSRYVIDLNRSPQDEPMYAGANNTELCPTRSFAGEPLYLDGRAPDDGEIARRREAYWQPYHNALRKELDRLKRDHGHAILFDAHSIRSRLPWLFEGKLPDLNLGTAGGLSCNPGLREALAKVLASARGFTSVADGRFRGGFITRHYGRPAESVHAVQLEMCWSCYMQEQAPYVIDDARAAVLRPVLRDFVAAMFSWEPEHA